MTAAGGDETACMNKEQFFEWQAKEDEPLKEKLGKGFEWTAEESATIFAGMQACTPD